MGIGQARGDDRAKEAAHAAISSPLLEASIDGARSVLINIAGGSDLGLFEANEAAKIVTEAAHPDANIILGAVVDDTLGDEVRVTVIAAGFDRSGPERLSDEPHLDEQIFSGLDDEEPPARREPEERDRFVFDAEEDLDIPSFLRNE
jgi:cell division protein FtsZ